MKCSMNVYDISNVDDETVLFAGKVKCKIKMLKSQFRVNDLHNNMY